MSSENIVSDPASRICLNEAVFNHWAEPLHLDLELIYDLPDELQGLWEASRKLPAWLGDPDAEQFKPYHKIFATEIERLQKGLARRTTDVGEQTDAETAEHLSLSLWPILSITRRYYDLDETRHLCRRGNQVQMKTAVDQLLNHVWGDRGVINFAHLLGRKLQLPESYAEGSIRVTKMISDSTVLLWHPAWDFREKFIRMSREARASSSCIPWAWAPAVLHWTTEYTHDDAWAASRKTRMAMVSGLYQRRALGFMDHFVFGTAHSCDCLDVFAGRWEPVESPAYRETGAPPAKQDAPTQARMPPEAVGSTLRSSNKPPNGSTSNLPEMDKYEIKIYRFPRYSLLSPSDMIDFYMLMRASRDLAFKYAADIFSDQYGKVHSVPVENCTWPGDSPRSEQKRTSLSQSLTPEIIEEGQRVCANVLPEQDDGADEWAVDDEGRSPLVTDQFDSDQIVQAYLRGLAHDKPAGPVVENVGYM